MKIINWLKRSYSTSKSVAYAHEKSAHHFLLICNYFEDNKLDYFFSRDKFSKIADQLVSSNKIKDIGLSKVVTHFKSNFLGRNQFQSEFFHSAKIEDNPDIYRMLIEANCDRKIQLIGCLCIIYNLRSHILGNPNHGQLLNDQSESIDISTNLLLNIMINM